MMKVELSPVVTFKSNSDNLIQQKVEEFKNAPTFVSEPAKNDNYEKSAPIENKSKEDKAVEELKTELNNPEIKSSEPKRHKGIKDAIAGIWKIFSVTNTMSIATAQGLYHGGLTGITVLAGAFALNFPKSYKKAGELLTKMSEPVLNEAGEVIKEATKIAPKFLEKISYVFKHPLKHIGWKGKAIAAVAGLAVLGYHLVKGKLQANQNTAVIEHKMNVGHRD